MSPSCSATTPCTRKPVIPRSPEAGNATTSTPSPPRSPPPAPPTTSAEPWRSALPRRPPTIAEVSAREPPPSPQVGPGPPRHGTPGAAAPSMPACTAPPLPGRPRPAPTLPAQGPAARPADGHRRARAVSTARQTAHVRGGLGRGPAAEPTSRTRPSSSWTSRSESTQQSSMRAPSVSRPGSPRRSPPPTFSAGCARPSNVTTSDAPQRKGCEGRARNGENGPVSYPDLPAVPEVPSHRLDFLTSRSEEHTSEPQSLMRLSYAV